MITSVIQYKMCCHFTVNNSLLYSTMENYKNNNEHWVNVQSAHKRQAKFVYVVSCLS